ncbi:hypothetical protein AVEN_180590-1, partial [Araneus ventricosus]
LAKSLPEGGGVDLRQLATLAAHDYVNARESTFNQVDGRKDLKSSLAYSIVPRGCENSSDIQTHQINGDWRIIRVEKER